LRAARLNQLSLERLTQHYQKVLDAKVTLDGILLEKVKNPPPAIAHLAPNWVAGYTPHYLRVFIPMDENTPRNAVVSAKPMQVLVDSAAGDVAFLGALSL
jgi:hypothetical protein